VTDQVVASAAVGPPPGMRIRLSSNESPYGPAPAAIAPATAVLGDAHRYPDDQSVALREAIAATEGVAVEQVAVGTGSAALLMDAIPHVCPAGGEVLAFERSFVVYRLAARNAGARYVEAPTAGPAAGAEDGYGRDVEALLSRLDPDTRVIVIDNPGNPTGAHLDAAQLRRLVAEVPGDVTIILDEAYHHFAVGQRGYATAAELRLEHPRLVVLRTFSKAYALAALRVGYVTGPSELIGAFDARRTRFNVTASGQAAALASLAAHDHLQRTVDGTREGRQRLAAALRSLGVRCTEGLGNFVTIELGAPSGPVVAAYAAQGIGVRPLEPYGMFEQVRVTVGTREELDAFLAASEHVLAGYRW
jgi:histidinol-phosphate aminotransferase